jgi:hypothetical protein
VKRPVWILYVFVVGLALHNLVMAQLWQAGLRGSALELVSAWKEALLALGLLLVVRARGRRPLRPTATDWLALAYGAVVVVYSLLPQRWLGGAATHRGVLLGAREDLLPVACYFFGRGLSLGRRDLIRLGATILATAAGVAFFGLVDIYAIPLSWWRSSSGAAGWFSDQLGFAYGKGLSDLPQNFVYNIGGGHPLRRLVSTFLSPLASSYLFVVALLLASVWRLALAARLRLFLPTVALLGAGLLWTHSRSSYIALALGLVVIAWRVPAWRRRVLLAAAVTVAVGLAFVRVYPHLAPATSFTPAELRAQIANAHSPGAVAAVNGFSDASISEHWQSLREGVRQVLDHPQGFGPGNAGSSAARTGVVIRAGESSYTQLGVDAGLAGGLLFVVWSLVLLRGLLRTSAWLAAAFAAMLALGLQTDIIGVPWLVYVLWTLAGASASGAGPPWPDTISPDGAAPAVVHATG